MKSRQQLDFVRHDIPLYVVVDRPATRWCGHAEERGQYIGESIKAISITVG
jgi:hypothetical protein